MKDLLKKVLDYKIVEFTIQVIRETRIGLDIIKEIEGENYV